VIATQLKCDETKPSCRNCQKKGQACPGYTLRLQWSTKYERPREPARPEPTNFDELVSAVTHSIVPGGHIPSPAIGERPLRFERSSPAESPTAAHATNGRSRPPPTPVPMKPGGSPPTVPRSAPSAPALACPPTSAHLGPLSLSLSADARHPNYSSSVDLTGANGFLDFNSNGAMGSTPVSGDSLWVETSHQHRGVSKFSWRWPRPGMWMSQRHC
jgi:hypothetical protein